jgi:hypothetical protein
MALSLSLSVTIRPSGDQRGNEGSKQEKVEELKKREVGKKSGKEKQEQEYRGED